MRTGKQLSVPLANRPGRLSAVLAAMAKEKVRVDAFCVMDSDTHSVLRFIPDNAEKAGHALSSISLEFEITEVLLVELNGQSGGMPRICQRLADEKMNIDYTYGSVTGRGAKGGGLGVIRVNDLAKAQRILGDGAGASLPKPRKKRSIRRPVHTL
jgi:hypothetical protein